MKVWLHVFKNTNRNYFFPFSIIKKHKYIGAYMKYIVEGQLLVELLKMVDKKSNLLALLLKQICVVGVFVYMELVEGAMDLGESLKM